MAKIWNGKATINIIFWAFIVFGYGYYLQAEFNFNPILLLIGVPIWILISFFIDTQFGFTEM